MSAAYRGPTFSTVQRNVKDLSNGTRVLVMGCVSRKVLVKYVSG